MTDQTELKVSDELRVARKILDAVGYLNNKLVKDGYFKEEEKEICAILSRYAAAVRAAYAQRFDAEHGDLKTQQTLKSPLIANALALAKKEEAALVIHNHVKREVEAARKAWEIEDGSAVKDLVYLQEQQKIKEQQAVENAMGVFLSIVEKRNKEHTFCECTLHEELSQLIKKHYPNAKRPDVKKKV